MLTAIVQHSQELVAFLKALNIVLYQPQIRHLIQIVDALLTSNETKTISGLYRLLKGQPSPKNGGIFCVKAHGSQKTSAVRANAGW
jgi:hypothetical protein